MLLRFQEAEGDTDRFARRKFLPVFAPIEVEFREVAGLVRLHDVEAQAQCLKNTCLPRVILTDEDGDVAVKLDLRMFNAAEVLDCDLAQSHDQSPIRVTAWSNHMSSFESSSRTLLGIL